MIDVAGKHLGETYSLILQDSTFEKRLHRFDPNLKLMFDQQKRKWCILQKGEDGRHWNLLLTAEDNEGNPKPLGEWIFNKLFVWRHNHEVKMRNPDQWCRDMQWKAEWEESVIETKMSLNHQDMLKDDIISWRKANRELKNQPSSDVTAGYPKIKPRVKGKIYATSRKGI